MSKFLFVMWLLLWPLVCSMSGYFDYLRFGGYIYPEEIRQLSAILEFWIWIFIAIVIKNDRKD